MNPSGNVQANDEYFFRLLYDCLHGGCSAHTDLSGWIALLSRIWMWIIYIGYALSVIALFIIIYCMVRLFELRKREHHFYTTLITPADQANAGHPRWEHIQELIAGTSPSQWREAIIEADIMLDDALTQAGYLGESISEKLKSIDRMQLASLQDAWEAHKVRNQIAHQGSAFPLTEPLARRTIQRYETVFRELHIISDTPQSAPPAH